MVRVYPRLDMENGAQVIDGAEVYSSLPVIATHNHMTREWHPPNIPLIEGVGGPTTLTPMATGHPTFSRWACSRDLTGTTK